MKKLFVAIVAIIIVIIGYFLISNTISHVSNVPANWLTYTENGIQFRYPESFGANVWKSVTWPPKVTVVNKNQDALALGCPMLKDTITTESGTGKSNAIPYLFYKGGDAGAGSLYTSTCYIFSGATQNYVIYFEVRSHTGCGNNNCGAYCGTEFEQECKDFDMMNDVVEPIEMIVSTVKFIQ